MHFIAAFLAWSLCAYLIHRTAHIKSKYNPLFKIHLEHHKTAYGHEKNYEFKWPSLPAYFLWFGNWNSSLDVWISLIAPSILVSFVFPSTHFYLVILVYFYEVFMSEHNLDHNPEITGKLTRLFAVGRYHLNHHRYPKYNLGLYVTIWDFVFVTMRPDTIDGIGPTGNRIEFKSRRYRIINGTDLPWIG